MDRVWLLIGLLSAGLGSPALLLPGTFHGDEVEALSGEPWWALEVSGREATLVPARLRIEQVRDEVLDAPGQESGKQVSSTVGDALVLLRGEGLRGGTVTMAKGDPTTDQPQPRHDLRLGATTYRIRTRCTPSGKVQEQEQARFACEIRLEAGERHQVLVRMGGYSGTPDGTALLGDDANPHLIFAGDLDRDGRLDLVFDVTDHYNVSRPTLFLSSQAGDGELVHQVAQFESVGC